MHALACMYRVQLVIAPRPHPSAPLLLVGHGGTFFLRVEKPVFLLMQSHLSRTVKCVAFFFFFFLFFLSLYVAAVSVFLFSFSFFSDGNAKRRDAVLRVRPLGRQQGSILLVPPQRRRGQHVHGHVGHLSRALRFRRHGRVRVQLHPRKARRQKYVQHYMIIIASAVVALLLLLYVVLCVRANSCSNCWYTDRLCSLN